MRVKFNNARGEPKEAVVHSRVLVYWENADWPLTFGPDIEACAEDMKKMGFTDIVWLEDE